METLETLTNLFFKLKKKEKTTAPKMMIKFIETDEFKLSGISEKELSESIDKVFKLEQEKIVNDMKKALSKL